MTLKKKMTFGLGFLFLIIFVLVIFYSYNIGKISRDAENILKDNYKSLVYAKNMISSIDEMGVAVTRVAFAPGEDKKASEYDLRVYEAARARFESNLQAENNNITEIHESGYVTAANQAYAVYSGLSIRILRGEAGGALYFSEFQPTSEKLRSAVDSIDDLNMQAVERKSQIARTDSARLVRVMAMVGVFCLLLAFFYFWYFPFYVSNSVAYLATRMRVLLKKSGIDLDIKTNDEAFIVLQGINLLESRKDAKDASEAPVIEG